MLKIGIIDDKEDERTDISDVFETVLEKEKQTHKAHSRVWETVASPPLPLLSDYPAWIYENKISALILDEKLRETPPPGYHINYDGHDVIDYIRPRLLNLPLTVVTNVPDDGDLDERFAKVDDIVPKATWGEKGEKIAQRVVNRAENYQNLYLTKLAKVDELSQKIALGTATEDEIEILRAIQVEFELPFVGEKEEINYWLENYEETVERFSELEKRAQSFVDKFEEGK